MHKMSDIFVHPTAVVDPKAELGEGVRIGPFCMVGPDVVLGNHVELVSHVAVAGRTSIGEKTRIFPFASIGHPPQDLKYSGEPSRLVIGARNVIRECVTMNPGTAGGAMETRVGDDCLFMANSHVAHDCVVADHVILANCVCLAGHCTIGEYAILGGLTGLHQNTRIGAHAFVGGHSAVVGDIIPYGMAVGNRAKLTGLNLIGLKRRNFDREAIHQLRAAYRMIFAREGALRERVDDAQTLFSTAPLVHEVLDFIIEGGDRALCLPNNGNGAGDGTSDT